ncbi:hypothetical protein FCN13_29120 [Pseudomonas sp. UMC631]|nr:hypothetical protein [Pseudomonas sp. UMA643]NTY22254.1 hypothetical protein [Pseudomonas sp. UMC3103]NTY28569.1 hypothetical protein [Pseudomonas sp. UMA603]NTY33996.1 hypothetical protein [Pseudomonas sp. UMC3129]NTY57643.1 hypothetical protein [Pseudomonas sp. UMC631]NTY65061.1 hypothetical protein [Pseudomonas sp. UMC3106]NUA38025.1 hypothetical protein [Pseudomonas sp. UMA601]
MQILLNSAQRQAAVAEFLRRVPALAREIELSRLEENEDVQAYRLRKGWAELCIHARAMGVEPWLFAHLLIGTPAEQVERLKNTRNPLLPD